MRNALLAAVAVLAACHPPSLRDRAVQLGGKISALGHATVRIVAPVVPPIDARAVANVAMSAAAQAAVAQIPVAQPQPIEIHHSVVRTASAAPEPAPVMTVHRVDAAPRTFFGMRYAKSGGGEACERFETIDACNSACTSLSQQRGMRGEPNANCSCLEDAPGC